MFSKFTNVYSQTVSLYVKLKRKHKVKIIVHMRFLHEKKRNIRRFNALNLRLINYIFATNK